tara:strand:- start:88 stop:477 length:390 start_codon:yes stop_codon:yes gene_type:complete
LNHTREALQDRSIKAVDSNDLANNRYSFGNTRSFQSKRSRFLSQKKVGGPTPLYQAMKYSYEEILDPYKPVDTIYVISDGEIGNLDERAKIYMLNSKLRIRINTICIQGRSDFLNGIATDNIGSFYLVN